MIVPMQFTRPQFSILTLLCALSVFCGSTIIAAGKPNVLFIMCDDLNDYIGVRGGHPQAKTPNLDRLFKSVVTFTQAHCNIPICAPSRSSLFTGLSPHTSANFAGAGVKKGFSYGESDEFGFKAALNETSVYDFNATILHLLGLDHERLTFYHNGLERRITNVHGHVIKDVLA